MDYYNSDILSVKMKITRWKEIIRQLTLEQTELSKVEKNISVKVNKLLAVLMKENKQKSAEDNDIDTLFNQDIEDELSLYEDRITIGKIANHEKERQEQKEYDIIQAKKELEEKRDATNRLKWQAQKKKNKRMKTDLAHCERKIDNLLKVMMISSPDMIDKTYNDLM